MNLVTQKFYKGDIVRIKNIGLEVEVLTATLARVKVKMPCTRMEGWHSKMYRNEDVEKVEN